MSIVPVTGPLNLAMPSINEQDVAPPESVQEEFAALLDSRPSTRSPNALLSAQSMLATSTMETALDAKVAGLVTQGVNKLVNMQ